MTKLITIFILFLSPSIFAEDPHMKPKPLLIDSDPALGEFKTNKDGSKTPRDIDDGLAIIEAINSKRVNVLAITTVFGNCPTSQVGEKVARNLLKLKKKKIPVKAGANKPLASKSTAPAANAAVKLMEAKLKASKEPVTILAIGPLTNIATLILRNKKSGLLKKVHEISIVMGRSPGQVFELGKGKKKISGIRDFNFVKDPIAAEIALKSGIPVRLAPFELSKSVVIDPSILRYMKSQKKTPVMDEIHSKSQAWMKYWMEQFNDGGFHPWDSAALGLIIRPEYFLCERRGYRIVNVKRNLKNKRERKVDLGVQNLEFGNGKGFSVGSYYYCPEFSMGGKKRFLTNFMKNLY